MIRRKRTGFNKGAQNPFVGLGAVAGVRLFDMRAGKYERPPAMLHQIQKTRLVERTQIRAS